MDSKAPRAGGQWAEGLLQPEQRFLADVAGQELQPAHKLLPLLQLCFPRCPLEYADDFPPTLPFEGTVGERLFPPIRLCGLLGHVGRLRVNWHVLRLQGRPQMSQGLPDGRPQAHMPARIALPDRQLYVGGDGARHPGRDLSLWHQVRSLCFRLCPDGGYHGGGLPTHLLPAADHQCLRGKEEPGFKRLLAKDRRSRHFQACAPASLKKPWLVALATSTWKLLWDFLG